MFIRKRKWTYGLQSFEVLFYNSYHQYSGNNLSSYPAEGQIAVINEFNFSATLV